MQHFIFLIFLFAYTHALWPFPPKRFTKNSLVEAGGLGLDSGRVVAFGDMNGDQLYDIHHNLYSFLLIHSFQYGCYCIR